MPAATKLVLVPGLLCTKALWAPQMAALADIADITVADHTRHDTMAGIAKSILAAAPERFALAGLSMGGYISYEIMRQAPERVTKLALLDTGARADPPERKEQRLRRNALAQREGAGAVLDELMSALIHKDRLADKAFTGTIRQMAIDIGAEGLIRQHAAIMSRPDNRPLLPSIKCPTLVITTEGSALGSVDDTRAWQRMIPNSELLVLPGNSYHVAASDADACAQAALAFIKRN